jgi:hypothetical protein
VRLVRTLRRSEPHAPIVIHHDVFQSPLDPAAFEGIDDVHLIAGDRPIVWGDLSMETARWRVFRWILANLSVDWVVLLSEQDYPIAPLRELRSRLATSQVDAFIDATPIDEIKDDSHRRECDLRYRYQYRPLSGVAAKLAPPTRPRAAYAHSKPKFDPASLGGLFSRYLEKLTRRKCYYYAFPPELNLPARVGWRASHTPFNADFQCWNNDAWFSVSTKGVQHLIAFLDAHPEYVSYCSHTIIPIESATASVLCNDPGLRVERVSLHTVRWNTDVTSGRPDVLTEDDLDVLRDSGAIFARKFAADAPVLDALDEIVLSIPTTQRTVQS